jgi:hypothetical protein
MGEVIPLFGDVEVATVSEELEPDLDEHLALLGDWLAVGQEIRRWSDNLSLDLRFELDELIRRTREA